MNINKGTKHTHDDGRPIVATSLRLGGGLHLSECVDGQGITTFWLLDEAEPEQTTDHLQGAGCCCRACAPHEQTGRLPAHIAASCRWVCGASTSTTPDGRPCDRKVPSKGFRCRQHQDTP